VLASSEGCDEGLLAAEPSANSGRQRQRAHALVVVAAGLSCRQAGAAYIEDSSK